jgi:hypothetical protein
MTSLTKTISIPTSNRLNIESDWNRFHRISAGAALLAVLVALTDITLTFLPSGAEQPGTMTAVDWYDLFQSNWFFGLRNLGLFPNILTLLLLVPVFLSLYIIHQRTQQPLAAAAVIFSLLGAAVYLANNAAFPMLALSMKYTAAHTESQRTLLIAAGEAVLARGEDFTPGTFPGFFLNEMATIMMAWAMLQGRIFSKATGFAGLLGGISLLVFTIWATYIPAGFGASMLLAMVGGISSIVWYILTSRKLFQLSTQDRSGQE